jgi:hypothetical protein
VLEDIQDDADGILPIAKSSFSLSQWSKWSLPGHGIADPDCGSFGLKGCMRVDLHQAKGYPSMIFVKKYKRSCGRAQCPVDFEKWASKEAHRATRRIEEFQRQYPEMGKTLHVVVSPSQADIDSLDYAKLRKKVYLALKSCSVRAGICIIHPFRLNHQNKTWYLSPHFHIVGFGWVRNSASFYQKTQWVVKNLGLRNSVYATIAYQLSHAGVYMRAEDERGKKTTVTWFGKLSYNQFKYHPEDEKEECPICGSFLTLLEWRGIGDPPLETLEKIEIEDEFIVPWSKDWFEVEHVWR